MTKNISYALNGVLIVAVAVLYYLHFSQPVQAKTDGPKTRTDSVKVQAPLAANNYTPKEGSIVFVNADSILEKYKYFVVVKKEVDAKRSALENAYKSAMEKFQADYEEANAQMSSGKLSQVDIINKRQEFEKRQNDILGMKKRLDEIDEEAEKKKDQLQKTLNEALSEYCRAHGYICILSWSASGSGAAGIDPKLDVTPDVLAMLNRKYDEMIKKPAHGK